MPNYYTIPQDVLFFRDARPMAATVGSGGHGARWPEPSIIFDAIHAALHRAFPVPEAQARDSTALQEFLRQQEWEWQHPHRYIACPKSGEQRNRNPDEKFRNQRFGALQTAGAFPAMWPDSGVAPTKWLFPAPADYVPHETAVRPFLSPMRHPGGQTNLPAPFLHPLASPCEPSKTEAAPWWSKTAIEKALRSVPPDLKELWQKSELYADEWTTGIAIDPATQTTGHGEAAGGIYSAQYLRLREGIALGFTASLPLKPASGLDGLTHLFPKNDLIICGGQQRACRVAVLPKEHTLKDLLPIAPVNHFKPCSDGRFRLKWLLLSPTVFPRISEASPGGWLPNWVAACGGSDEHNRPFKAGDVLLKPAIPTKGPGESREAWRKRIAREVQPIRAWLVAARVPKHIAISGWSERLHQLNGESADPAAVTEAVHGPRQTLLAVPAGAVYYFETDQEKDARALASMLSWHGDPQSPGFGLTIKNRRSTLLGEKGFGLGVCGTWDFFGEMLGSPGR